MNNNAYEYISNLQYCLKAARKQVADFKSGEKYVRMTEEHKNIVRELEKTIRALKKELEEAKRETIRVRELWFQAFEEELKDREQERCYYERELKKMEQCVLKAEAERDLSQNKVTELRQENYRVKTELEEEKGKNQKLTAQLNHDYENSSLPSSLVPNRKKISNSREKTDRKPGGQPGHTGRSRKKQEPTEVIQLVPPQEVLDDPGFKKTNKTIVKQIIGIQMSLVVKEYRADVYYNSKTGERRHASFPAEAKSDVNYDGSIKAFLYLLNNDCCVSIDKCSKFLADLTDGKLNISKGMINGLG